MEISTSILNVNEEKITETFYNIEAAKTDYFHIDVMDGHFVPNISYGASVMKSLNNCDTAKYDVHLMIENADDYVEDFVTDKTEYIVVHQEACVHLYRSLQNIKSFGVKAGVALNPATPLCMIEEILADVDLVLVMSVEPGFGGQKFIEASLEKIKRLAKIRSEKGFNFKIEVDGGVSTQNAKKLIEAGADILVAGSAVFGAEDIPARMNEFRKEME